ncbi:MAG: HD domain-containing protein [Saprospiraceae bacterium]
MKITFTPDEKELFALIANASNNISTESFIVGGFIRDKLLSRPSKDIDITCIGDGISLAKEVKSLLKVKSEVNIFKNFGTAQIKTKGFEIEFVGARKESYNYNSRKPNIEPGSFMDDILRRDFTINTLSVSTKHIENGDIIDNLGGVEDLKNQVLKTPLDPDITFSDDPLRMMRAIRFATQLNFNIESNTFEAIKRNKERIAIVSIERITDELQKIIASKKPSIGFKLLNDCGLLKIIFPEFTDLQGIDIIEGLAHKDNFYHTLQVLDNISEKSDNIWLRWAAILHDIGKSKTKRFVENEGWTFHSHEIVGANMVYKIFLRFKLPLDNKMKYVQNLVKLHLRPMALVDNNVTDSAVRRLLFDAGDDIDDLMVLAKSDITSKNQFKIDRFLENYDKVIQKLADIEEKDKLRNWQPPITGDEIMEVFSLKPSKEVGIIKTEIREAILDGIIENNKQEAWKYMIETGIKMNLKVSDNLSKTYQQ